MIPLNVNVFGEPVEPVTRLTEADLTPVEFAVAKWLYERYSEVTALEGFFEEARELLALVDGTAR